jgi:hypothetical protein
MGSQVLLSPTMGHAGLNIDSSERLLKDIPSSVPESSEIKVHKTQTVFKKKVTLSPKQKVISKVAGDPVDIPEEGKALMRKTMTDSATQSLAEEDDYPTSIDVKSPIMINVPSTKVVL